MIDVADGLEVQLVPVVWTVFTGVTFVFVLDSIAEPVLGAGQAPSKNLLGIAWVSEGGRVCAQRRRRAVDADQSLLAAHLPIGAQRIAVMEDLSEQTLRSRTVAR